MTDLDAESLRRLDGLDAPALRNLVAHASGRLATMQGEFRTATMLRRIVRTLVAWGDEAAPDLGPLFGRAA